MFHLGTLGRFSYLFKPSQIVKPTTICSLLQINRRYKIEKIENLPRLPEDYEERNEMLKKALSPHLKVYKFEMPSWQSIGHRTTGIILSVYLITLGVGALILPHEFRYYIEAIDNWDLNASVITFGKFLFALPFTIHFIGGVKHLMWDVAPQLLKRMSYVFYAGYAVFGIGVIMAAGLAFIKTDHT